jgi:hypothetical protein
VATVAAANLVIVSAPRQPTSWAVVSGALLILVGLAAWALYAVQAGTEKHSYTHGGPPPAYVQFVDGHTYWLAIPGGVDKEVEQGLDPAALQCTAAAPGQGAGALPIQPENGDSKATDQIASFVSTFTATAHIDCTGIGVVYVDNARDAQRDWSGFWLVLASIALAIGIPLTLSTLRRPPASGPAPATLEGAGAPASS